MADNSFDIDIQAEFEHAFVHKMGYPVLMIQKNNNGEYFYSNTQVHFETYDLAYRTAIKKLLDNVPALKNHRMSEV